jgi:hypothetical protein
MAGESLRIARTLVMLKVEPEVESPCMPLSAQARLHLTFGCEQPLVFFVVSLERTIFFQFLGGAPASDHRHTK